MTQNVRKLRKIFRILDFMKKSFIKNPKIGFSGSKYNSSSIYIRLHISDDCAICAGSQTELNRNSLFKYIGTNPPINIAPTQRNLYEIANLNVKKSNWPPMRKNLTRHKMASVLVLSAIRSWFGLELFELSTTFLKKDRNLKRTCDRQIMNSAWSINSEVWMKTSF